MSKRAQHRKAFLKKAQWDMASAAPVSGDASFRSYERLQKNGQTMILMDAPPEFEKTLPFEAIGLYLKNAGYSAPTIYASDRKNGFLLLEDLGTAAYKTIIHEKPEQTDILYQKAMDVLLSLAQKPPRKNLETADDAYMLPDYDMQLYKQEIDLFTDWYLPLIKAKSKPDIWPCFKDPLQCIIAQQADFPILVLRDYHAENLLWLEKQDSIKKVGLLDFQDAVIGHPAYDLVSLLEDARTDIEESFENRMLNYYLDKAKDILPDVVFQNFRTAYHLLGVQRNLKIIGIFARLYLRDNKPRYLDYIPRVWGYVERNLKSLEGLNGLQNILEEHVPANVRKKVPCP